MAAETSAPRRSRWPALLLIVVLGAGVIAVNALYNALARAQTVLSAPAGDVIYAAGFDGFEDEWQQYEGRLSARIADGTLRLSVDDTNATIYSLAQPVLGDFDLRVQATPSAGPIDNGYGVIFRLHKQADACDMPLQVLCDLAQVNPFSVPLRLLFRPTSTAADGYYMFLISADGYYSVWKAASTGSSTEARRVSAWIASDAIRQGLAATNSLRIIARGDTFTFAINDQAVALCLPDDPTAQSTYAGGQCIDGQMQPALVDSNFAVGQIGLAAQTTLRGGTGVIVEFDNLIITSPAAPREVQA